MSLCTDIWFLADSLEISHWLLNSKYSDRDMYVEEKVTQIDGAIGRCQACFFPLLCDLYFSEDCYAIPNLFRSATGVLLALWIKGQEILSPGMNILFVCIVCINYVWRGYLCLGMFAHTQAHVETRCWWCLPQSFSLCWGWASHLNSTYQFGWGLASLLASGTACFHLWELGLQGGCHTHHTCTWVLAINSV